MKDTLGNYLERVNREMEVVRKMNPQIGEGADMRWYDALQERVVSELGFYDSTLLRIGDEILFEDDEIVKFLRRCEGIEFHIGKNFVHEDDLPLHYGHIRGGILSMRVECTPTFLVHHGGRSRNGNTLFHTLEDELVLIKSVYNQAKDEQIYCGLFKSTGEELGSYSPK